jgi:hypothetical protein
MKNWRMPLITGALLLLFAVFSRCSDTGPDLTAEQPFKFRTEVRQQGAVTVRAAVLTDDDWTFSFRMQSTMFAMVAFWRS